MCGYSNTSRRRIRDSKQTEPSVARHGAVVRATTRSKVRIFFVPILSEN